MPTVVGLTHGELRPEEYVLLRGRVVSLTDIVKGQAGMDDSIMFRDAGVGGVRSRILSDRYQSCYRRSDPDTVYEERLSVEFSGIRGGPGEER